jgi:3-keto-disaccharide hydrolase
MAQAITRFYTLSAAVAAVATVPSAQAAGPGNFKPDGMVTGSALSGWHIVGDADWKAQDGELVGKAKGGGNGGWLVMDKSFQDVQLYANYRCTGQCTSGILLRAQKTADGGMNGVYVSLTDGDTASYFVTIDAQGKEVARERLAAPAGRGGGGSGNPGRGARSARSGGCGRRGRSTCAARTSPGGGCRTNHCSAASSRPADWRVRPPSARAEKR